MKFILIVLIIRFAIELVSKKNKIVMEEDQERVNNKTYHPSEFQLR